ncbi:stage V sporulation protein B [Paenibacillus thalictri]|uniref:Stage V sporulation protein B n=1 Tax=Paenibacillus thalictri TaxID=2527873 RepID=A0A4Q9DWY8_9BACL|nr:stage V sporulation protein B [Paenibacillus thalictri]TBL81599.1 stage V sporulation protein B [Paenibacillus thalictri]
MTKQTFIQGTMILLAAGIVNRILGFIPRIALPRIIGPEGIGLYQMGYPFLIVVLTLVTGGIPIAIAKLVAEAEAENNEARIRSILKISMTICATLGLLFTAGCLLAAKWITAHLFTDPRVYYTFLCMSPIILFVSISAVYRGYFQGRQNMIPTALSQVVETLVRIVTILAFAYWLMPYGLEYAAAGAMIGVMVGEIAATLVLMSQYAAARKLRPAFPKSKIGSVAAYGRLSNLKQLLSIAVPVTGSKLVGSCSYFLESILTVQSLAAAGIATKLATAQYGALQGMVFPILLLPSALTYSLSVSLIPSLSEAAAQNDMKTIHSRLHQSLRLALVTGAPFATLMFVLAEPLCLYMYNQSDVGTMLKMMAPIAMFIYLQAPLQAALQALDRPGTALVNTLTGSVVKLTCIYWVASMPSFGILGVVLAINLNIVLVTLLHWQSVVRLLKFRMEMLDFAKVGAAMALTGIASYLVMSVPWSDSNLLRFLSACTLGGGLYLLLTVVFRLVDKSDLLRIFTLGRKIWR